MNTQAPDFLKFGTDGWRDLIADRFTFANLARAAQGYAEALLETGGTNVLVGHDTRFLGRDFALLAARILASNGLEVRVSEDYLPTPALSFAVRHLKADGAVMLTASHNPYRYQGFKLKAAYGGSATEDFYRKAAERINATERVALPPASCEAATFDIRSDYYSWLDRSLDVDLLRTARGLVIHDAMGGAAAGWIRGWLKHAKLDIQLDEIRERPDPLFHGVNPEPIEANLAVAQDVAVQKQPLFVTATDGDGDRLGVVLPDGTFFNSHQIFAVLLLHLYRRGGRGRVIKTFTVSRVVERLASHLGLKVLETPVGFKYIAEAMLDGDVLIGGEESGGLGVGAHIPERDGILNSLLLLESIAVSGKGLATLFKEAEELADWKHAYDRLDLQLEDQEHQSRLLEALSADVEVFLGHSVDSIERLDGVKFNLRSNAWLLFRASGTEPVLRVYCEAPSAEAVRGILGSAEQWVRTAGKH